MHMIVNTTERRVIVYVEGYDNQTITIQDMEKWREGREICLEQSDVAPLIQALQSIQIAEEQHTHEFLRWQIDDDDLDDGIPF